MTLVLTRPSAFQKPTHLHSHLLFCNRTDQPEKSKRECKPTHPDSATIQCKLGRTQLWTDRRAACNSTFAIGGVSCSADSLVVAESFVLRIKFSGKNPAHRKSAKRYRSLYGDSANIKRQCKNGRQNNFGQAVWLSFAKAKEKQCHPQANPQLLHICFCPNAQRPCHFQLSFLHLKSQIFTNN